MRSPSGQGTDKESKRDRPDATLLKGTFFYIILSSSSVEMSLLMMYLYLRLRIVSTFSLAKYGILAAMLMFLAFFILSFINAGTFIKSIRGDEKHTVRTTFSWVVSASVIALMFYVFALFVLLFPHEFHTGVFTTTFLIVLAALTILATVATLKAMKFMKNFSVLVNEPAYMRIGKFIPITLGSFISVVALVVYYSYHFAPRGALTFKAVVDELMSTFLFYLILGMMIPILAVGLMSVYGYAISLKHEDEED
ncbi:MAG: hypothetical protein QW046_04270 [Candidatus Micrarchaeaceae archaeon]